MTASSRSSGSQPPTDKYWDDMGGNVLPHVACLKCGEVDEVGSFFDAVWCCYCGWRGDLIEQHQEAKRRHFEASSRRYRDTDGSDQGV